MLSSSRGGGGGGRVARWVAGALRAPQATPGAGLVLALALSPAAPCRAAGLARWWEVSSRVSGLVGRTAAVALPCRCYATAGSSGSSSSGGAHDHHRATEGRAAASGRGAGGGSGSNTSGSSSGSGAAGAGGAGTKRQQQQQEQVRKRMKKGKSARRIVKRKRAAPGGKASFSSASGGTPAAAGSAAASGGSGAAASGVSRARPARRALTLKQRAGAAAGGSGSGSSGGAAGGSAPRRGSALPSPAPAPPGVRVKPRKHKRLRVCVLSSSYDGADSATAGVDNYWCTPQHYVKKDRNKYVFADVAMKKADSYRTVRELVTSHKYDVFFNLCDGGRDEKRAGVDVVQALEEHNAAFTGTDSRSFEPSKIDMKLMVGSSGVTVPNFVLLHNEESLAKKCRHLKFPVIVKHLSGYASVGINKDSRCDTLDQLRTRVRGFITEYNHALVEEFIRGREGTVLACADPGSPHGVKVFKPLMFHFLQNGDDFAYFEKKWTMECSEQAYGFLPSSDPAYAAITEMARNAFKYIMNGVGYGRVDFRIDDTTGVPYFLEINPNCGMWYAPKDGGDFADVMVEGDAHWNHERFLANAVTRALRDQAARKPWYFISHDRNGQFSTRASKTVAAGKCLYGDAVHPVPVVAKALYKLGEEEPTVGCVICRGDGVHQAVALRHSCEPNMNFVHGRTLLFAAKRQINVGEELTVDYATLRDEAMPHFVCSCGTENCRSVIFPMPAMPRTVEAKTMKRLLREKKQIWMKEKADREAERILKKRATPASSSATASSGSGTAASASGSSGSSAGGSGGNSAADKK